MIANALLIGLGLVIGFIICAVWLAKKVFRGLGKLKDKF